MRSCKVNDRVSILVAAALLMSTPGPVEIPGEVRRCMEAKKLWLAAPKYFETFEFTHEGGDTERAIQIHDTLQGADGFILLFPGRCRVVVFVQQPIHPLAFSRHATISAPTPASRAERAVLLKWAGVREYDSTKAYFDPITTLLRLDGTPTPGPWREGRPRLSGVRAWMDGTLYSTEAFERKVLAGTNRVVMWTTKTASPVAIVAVSDGETHRYVGAFRVPEPITAQIRGDRLWLQTTTGRVGIHTKNGEVVRP